MSGDGDTVVDRLVVFDAVKDWLGLDEYVGVLEFVDEVVIDVESVDVFVFEAEPVCDTETVDVFELVPDSLSIDVIDGSCDAEIDELALLESDFDVLLEGLGVSDVL
jgi:hypothetical protein